MPSLNRPDLDKIIGQNVRIARSRVQPPLTQAGIARSLGCSFQQVQKYEAGRNSLSATTLLRIAEMTGQPVEWFFVHDETSAQPEQVAA